MLLKRKLYAVSYKGFLVLQLFDQLEVSPSIVFDEEADFPLALFLNPGEKTRVAETMQETNC